METIKYVAITGEKCGPTVSIGPKEFSVSASYMDSGWFTNPLELFDGRTVGQANKEQVHKWLDEFIANLLTGEK